MFIPGELIALLTFPGVILHEIAHRFMCDILKVKVYDVKYFAIGSTRAGHVYHHKTDNSYHDFLIGFAPLFINSFFCIIFTFPYTSTVVIANEGTFDYASIFLYWVGISMGACAFPSNQDIENVLASPKNKGMLCDIMKCLNRLSFFWVDFIYAATISFILPFLIFGKCTN